MVCLHLTSLFVLGRAFDFLERNSVYFKRFSRTMSEIEEIASSTDSSSEKSGTESESEEMEVVSIVQPYADEPLAHSSDEDEDEEDDQDGLTPAVLRSRFEDEVSVSDW